LFSITVAIAMMESQIETIKDSLAALKAKKKKEKTKLSPAAPPPKEKKPPAPVPKKPAKKPQPYAPPVYQPSPGPSRTKETQRKPPATTKAAPPKKAKAAAAGGGGGGSDTEKSISTMSFEQKKELSTTIESLDGDKLEKVIQIIYEGMPDLQNVRVFTVLHHCWGRLHHHDSRMRRSSWTSSPSRLPC
jgi:hypothetical protein